MTKKPKIKPFLPVNYDPVESRLINLISSKNLTFDMMIGSKTASVTLGFDNEQLPYQGLDMDLAPHIAFEAADELWQVCFKKTRSLYELMEMADVSGFFKDTAPESLPEDVFWATLEAFLSPGLGKTESAIGYEVKLAQPVYPAPSQTFSLGFALCFTDETDEPVKVHGFLQIPYKGRCIHLIEDLFSGFPGKIWEPELLPDIGKRIAFQAGSLALPVEELAAMKTGDVLLPDIWHMKNNQLILNITPYSFICDFDAQDNTARIKAKTDDHRIENSEQQPVKSLTDISGKENMTEENQTIENELSQEEIIKPSSLDLDLVFEVGRSVMTLEEIGKLSKGQVISLPHKIDDGVPVDVKMNGQLVARGKIVGVGDEIGIQITRTGA